MIIDEPLGLIRVAAVSVLAYALLVLVLRVAGKRALAKLNAFDLVVTVAFGSTLATILLSDQVTLAEGVLALVMLALLQWIVSRLSISSERFGKLVRSEPTLLFEDGRYREGIMWRERVTRSEIEAAIRQAGVAETAEVGGVILETNGTLSVIPRASNCDVLSNVRR